MSFGSKFDIDLRRGEAREDALVHLFLRSRVEVKADHKAHETGNVFIEFKQPDGFTGWKPSGIAVSKADRWALELVGLDRWIIVRTQYLYHLAQRAYRERGCVWGGDGRRFKGVLVPISWFTELFDGRDDGHDLEGAPLE